MKTYTINFRRGHVTLQPCPKGYGDVSADNRGNYCEMVNFDKLDALSGYTTYDLIDVEIRASLTYSVVTEESAINGDTADHGFLVDEEDLELISEDTEGFTLTNDYFCRSMNHEAHTNDFTSGLVFDDMTIESLFEYEAIENSEGEYVDISTMVNALLQGGGSTWFTIRQDEYGVANELSIHALDRDSEDPKIYLQLSLPLC